MQDINVPLRSFNQLKYPLIRLSAQAYFFASEKFPDDIRNSFASERLTDIFLHPGLETKLTVALQRICRNRNNYRASPAEASV